MICKECMHAPVCQLKEHYAKIEDHYKGLVVDEAFTVTVLCKYKKVEVPRIKGEELGPIIWNVERLCWE